MSDASSLHCPNCGASVDPDARRCPYCRARLATVSCPSCFALMFEGAAYCPKCGHRRARVDAETTAAKCPGCGGDLQRVELEATALLECRACDGVWLEADEFERLCTDQASQAAVLHRFTAPRPPGAERVRYRRCARCGKMMNRVNFGRLSGTIVDVCKGHGTFLDPGELHQIVEFIHAGGLDRARAQQIEEMKEQERRLHAQEAKAARERGAADPHAALDFSGKLPAEALIKLITLMRE
jgi:Zn-finger nucleic acid-binding protein